MFEFHYVHLKPNFNLEMLCSDTDSFIYMVKSEDVYEDLKELGNHSDFSNYPKDSPIYCDLTKKTLLKFKYEMADKKSSSLSG